MNTSITHKFKYYPILDLIVGLLVLVLFLAIRPDYLLIAVYFLAWPYIFMTRRYSLIYILAAASVVSVAWQFIAHSQYDYAHGFIKIAGMDAFPLFAWTLGLTFLYIAYMQVARYIKQPNYLKSIALFAAIYWPLLIVVETIGYYSLDIHNLGTAQYAGLPLCDCLHAPVWMQIAYFSTGLIFFSICYYVLNRQIIGKNNQ